MPSYAHMPSYKANFDECSPDGEAADGATDLDLTTLILNANQAAAAAMHAMADADLSPDASVRPSSAVSCMLGDSPDHASSAVNDEPAHIAPADREPEDGALALAHDRMARQWEQCPLRTTPTPLCAPPRPVLSSRCRACFHPPACVCM